MQAVMFALHRRHLLCIGVLGAIALGFLVGLSPNQESESGSAILTRLPPTNQQMRSQVAALIALQEQSPEHRLLQASNMFAWMRATGQEQFGGMIERMLVGDKGSPPGAPLPELVLSLPASLMLADLYQYQHRFDDALALLISVEEQAADNSAYWRLRANLYRIRGELQSMNAACRRGAALDRFAWTILCDAEIASLRGQPAMTEELLDQLLLEHSSLLHQNADLMVWVADLFDRAGRVKQADVFFRKSLLVAPTIYTVDRVIQFQLKHHQVQAANATVNWWRTSGQAPLASWRLSAAIVAAAAGNRSPAENLLKSLQQNMTDRPQAAGASIHWRELARLAVALEPASETARHYALRNWQQQKETIDALLLAQAANASRHTPTLVRLATELHVRDMSGLHTELVHRGWL